METRRWTNPHQPQTLQIAVFLLYATAVLTVLIPPSIYTYLGARFGVGDLASLLAAAALAAGAFGIANEKRWGYRLAVGVTGAAVVELMLILAEDGISNILNLSFMLLALFPVVRFALLLHPMSRDHQRIWFS